jgi:transcriptional regulator with XRE-family HTH domain
MDVRINSKRIIVERENRAWSQQHLAEAAGLALRTIQRIEAHGTGSYESAKAIASCLGTSVVDLRESTEPERGLFARYRPAAIGGSLVGVSLLAGVATLHLGSAFAQQVLLDVSVTREEAVVGESGELGTDVRSVQNLLLVGDGEERALPMEGEFNLVVTPIIAKDVLEGNKVVLSVRFFEHREHGFELVGEPRRVTPDGEEIEFQFPISGDPELSYTVAITPQLRE